MSALTNSRRLATAAVIFLTALVAGTSHSAEFREAASPNYFSEQPGVNLEIATSIVRTKTGGRVLSASPVSRGDTAGYKVRVLVDQRVVQTWFVDQRGRARSESRR